MDAITCVYNEVQSVKVALNVHLSVLVLKNAMITANEYYTLYVIMKVYEYHYVTIDIKDQNFGTEWGMNMI